MADFPHRFTAFILQQGTGVRRKLSILFSSVLALLIVWAAWQFRIPPAPPALPVNYHAEKAAWVGVTWSMDPHTDSEINLFARDLEAHGITTIFAYVSYMKPGDLFNPTYEHASAFTQRLHRAATGIKVLAWIGVPVQVTQPDGEYVEDRLADPAVRRRIADFSAKMVNNYGFDGVHLNAEFVMDGSAAFIETLQTIRAALPANALLSTTAHPLRVIERVTSIPYPVLGHHWSIAYLQRVAENADEIALMAYDSGLFFPTDYRAWMAYQVRSGAAALTGSDVSFLVGVPVSEEWTPSHHVIVETLENALYGVRMGLSESKIPQTIDGLAVYPYWEIDSGEWELLDEFR